MLAQRITIHPFLLITMGDAGLPEIRVARRFAKNKQDVWFVKLLMLLLLRQ